MSRTSELFGDADLTGTGNGEANSIFGNTGANLLDGKGGADSMLGNLGDDTYVVDDVNDVVTEAWNRAPTRFGALSP